MSDQPDKPRVDEAPIRLKNRRVGCENRLMQVFLDEIEGAGGQRVNDFLVLAPRQHSEGLVTGVAVLPVLDGRFGLLRVYRHPVRAFMWEVPRGFVEAGENDSVSALRELEEETGLTCDPRDMVDLGTVAPEAGIMAGRTRLYAATKCRRERAQEVNELGHKEFRLLNREAMIAMSRSGEIEDANTLVAWYRYLQE